MAFPKFKPIGTGNVVYVPLSMVKVLKDLNVRDESAYSELNSRGLRDDIAQNGQQTPAVLQQNPNEPGTLIPVIGHRRTLVLQDLAAAGVIDPSTMKTDPEGNKVAGTGKPFEFIKAIVHENLTPLERANMMTDHSQTRSLSKVELIKSAWVLFEVKMSFLDVTIKLFDLLNLHYPVKKALRDMPETTEAEKKAKFEKIRAFQYGTLQIWKRAFSTPEVCRQQILKKERGDAKWPVNKEIELLADLHKQDLDEDKTGTINRFNPGPKFMELWNRILEAVRVAEESGTGNKPKSAAIMNPQQMTESANACDSRILKIAIRFIKRELPDDQLPVFDKALVRLQAGEVTKEEFTAILDEITKATPAAVKAPEVKPDSEQKSE